MLVSLQDLRSIQERCEIGELVQMLDVSIDRLTVIWDTDTGSLRRIFKNLKQAISTRVDSFEIYDNVRDDVFTLAKVFNEYDSINIIFFQLSTYGGEQLIRIDFNPMKFVTKERLLLIIAVLKQKSLQSQKLNRFCKNFV